MGIKRGKVLLARDNEELIKLIEQRNVDIVTETPFSSILYCKKAGMKVLLRRWKKGAPTYSSVIFVRKDSNINSLNDLKGKVIAFEDPGSTTGYFLPKAEIMKKGFQLVELNNSREKPPSNKIGYCFAESEANIVYWVHKGFAAAGALNNLEYEYPEEVPIRFMPDFKIIFATEMVPRALMLIRGDISPQLEMEIKKVLLNMKFSKDGRKAMWKMTKTVDFDEFSEGPEEAMRRFEEKYTLISEEIEKLEIE
jgi:phosphonate transport system substrate-binding protein